MKRLALIMLWFSTSVLTLVSSFLFFSYRENINLKLSKAKQTVQQVVLRTNSYQMYSSLPKVLGSSTFSVKTGDAIPELAKIFSQSTPMELYVKDFVKIAKKNGLDDKQLIMLLVIGKCESGLGKNMPEDCYNPFGWGIHSQGTLCFESWQEGFEKVTSGFKKKYIDKGLTTPEEIMEVYCPLSLEKGGSWAKCINHFLEDIL